MAQVLTSGIFLTAYSNDGQKHGIVISMISEDLRVTLRPRAGSPGLLHPCSSGRTSWFREGGSALDVPGATGTYAWGINNSGQIVGGYSAGGRGHGFLLDVDGSYTTLDVPGATSTDAYGINDAGQIVGSWEAGDISHGFLATPK
jgi:uncharacterized membrane protein